MESKAAQLLEGENIPRKDSEQIAEEIDEAIHSLQYKLDHCKRLLQGSETDAESSIQGISNVNTVFYETDAKRIQLKGRLNGLKATATHLVEHIKEAVIDKDTLQEIHEHMEHMDIQLSSFHSSVEIGIIFLIYGLT
jgi:phage shock protein A